MTNLVFSFRSADPADILILSRLDPLARSGNNREKFIHHAISSKNCHIIQTAEDTVGYGIMDYSFFGNAFISMLIIMSEQRRLGAGSELMRYLETISRTDKLFSSTNLSNLPMQSLLLTLHYSLSGIINNLDENDPELIFFKSLKSNW